MKVMKVKVVRPFYFERKVQAAGQVIELPELFARECLAAKKVELVEDLPQAEVKVEAKAEVHVAQEPVDTKEDSKGATRKK